MRASTPAIVCIAMISATSLDGLIWTPVASPGPLRGLCQGDGTIIPGDRVGPIKFGMPLAQVRAILSGAEGPMTPPRAPSLSNIGFFEGINEGLTVIGKDGRMAMITLTLKQGLRPCATREGVHVGSTADEIRRAYGEPPGKSRSGLEWVYNERGLAFTLTPPDGRNPGFAHHLDVFAPGRFCQINDLMAETGWASPCDRFSPHP